MPVLDLRPVTLEQVDELCALANRTEQFEGIPRVHTADELREDLEAPHLDVSADTRAAYLDGELAGWAWIWNPPSEVTLERAYLFGEVDPAHRGQGVGRALLAWSLSRAEERLRARDHDLPRYVRVDAYDFLDANHRLYARMGFEPIRWFEELVRPLEDLPAVVVPDGLELRPWPDDRDEELRIVHNDAFADHWGSAADRGRPNGTPPPPGTGPGPDLSFVAVEEDTGQGRGHLPQPRLPGGRRADRPP